jgi:hypothetical protein
LISPWDSPSSGAPCRCSPLGRWTDPVFLANLLSAYNSWKLWRKVCRLV